MAGGFPLGLELCNGTSVGADQGNSRGTAVPANSGSAGTFSSWVQLIASTAADATWIHVSVQYVLPQFSTGIQVNIGVGAAASEKIIIQKLFNVGFDSNTTGYNYLFPINIPAGTRISAQSAGDHANTENGVYVNVQLFDSGFAGIDGCAGVDNIGITSNHGTAISAGSGTKGSYVQLTGSTARDYMGFYVVVDPGGGATFGNTGPFIGDIAVGAASSEKIIVADFSVATITVFTQGNGVAGPYFVPIPSGTAVSARGTTASGGAITFGVMLLAMYK